jgi:O-antigen/teichoic acid export membrane protein
MTDKFLAISRGSLLVHNTVLNLLGQVIPILAALFSIPFLLNGLGIDRFGALSLAWVITGYFGIFDLGIGRALTKMVAENLGRGQIEKIPAIVWSAMFLVVLMGVLGVIIMCTFTPYLVLYTLKIPLELVPEIKDTLYLLSLSIPIVICAACFRGILEAYQRFDLIQAVRVPAGALTFLGPSFVLLFSQNLVYVIASLVVVRFVECFASMFLCVRIIPGMIGNIVVEKSLLKTLIRFGSWMTVSNVIGPLIVYSDRLLIGSLISIASVAYYMAPHEMVNKLMVIPGAFVGVLFPAFGLSFVRDSSLTKLLYCRGIKYVFIFVFPIILIIVTLSFEALYLWLGQEFSLESGRILQWLAVGAFFNSQSFIPSALLHAGGRPDLTAKLYIIEAPFYLIAIWYLIGVYGVEGAAIAWVLRVAIETLILFWMAQKLLPIGSILILRFLCSSVGAILLLFIAANLPMDLVMKTTFLIIALLSFTIASWRVFLDHDERLFTRNYFKKLKYFKH